MLAFIAEAQAGPHGKVLHGRRDEDLPGFRLPLDAGPDVDGHTGQLGAVDLAFPGVDRQVTAFPVLRDALNDAGLTNLDGTGLPFAPADFTGAWQGPLPDPGGAFAVNLSIFIAGFEFGNTSEWSSQVPPP